MSGSGERRAILSIYSHYRRINITLVAGYALAAIVAGPWVLHIWTHARINMDMPLFILLLAASSLYAIWHLGGTMLGALSQHESYATAYISVSILAVFTTMPMSAIFGGRGVAFVLMIAELIMLWVINILWSRWADGAVGTS